MKKSDFKPGVQFQRRLGNGKLSQTVFQFDCIAGDCEVLIIIEFKTERHINIELNDDHLRMFYAFGSVLMFSEKIPYASLQLVQSPVIQNTTI
jgi:hypothetical protein